ncbi:MAG TPA: radical SAM protein [Dehalococcoidia bacterium]|nr:radical SAM protein [Dehalococcoidia bacterium]
MPIHPPFLVSYSITTQCNLTCKHCYSEATDKPAEDELTTKEALRLIDELSDWGIGLLVLDGGEPLCREDCLEIASYASKKGIITGIGSNGTFIDTAMAREMKAAGIQSIAISIDGADAKTHDAFRGKSSAFAEALAGAAACKAAGLAFQFNMVIRKETAPQLPTMLNLAVTSGANAAEFFDLVEAGRAKRECRGQSLEPEQRKQVMEWLAQAQIDCPILIRVCACPMYPLTLQQRQIQPKHFPAQMLARIPYYGRGCAAGMPSGYIVIRANGEINPCMLLQINLGNVRQQSLRQIWDESSTLNQLRSRKFLKGECGRCDYKTTCSGCRGRAYEQTGDMLAADPACWLAPVIAR